jgi:hypothetical protein
MSRCSLGSPGRRRTPWSRRTWSGHTLRETHEGLADFHAAGRHSYVTGLLRNGASITEARELARHADVRMTMRYTHIGLEDQARALASLPAPGGCAQRLSSAPAVVSGHASAAADANDSGDASPENDEIPSGEGVSSLLVVASQELAFDVSSGGGGNCTRERCSASRFRAMYLRRWPPVLAGNGLEMFGTR